MSAIDGYAVMYQFPSGEWAVESHTYCHTAQAVASVAAAEEVGREVFVVERISRFVLTPGEVVED